MNKKYMAFGIIAFFALAFVTAGLVTYLGNSVEVDMEINSPIQYNVEGAIDGILTFLPAYGGETFEFTITAENLAGVDTLVEAEHILSNIDGLTCEDVQSASVDASSTDGWTTTLNLGEPGFSCEIVDEYNVRFFYGETIDLYSSGRKDTMDIAVTFAPNALGTYKLTATPLFPTA